MSISSEQQPIGPSIEKELEQSEGQIIELYPGVSAETSCGKGVLNRMKMALHNTLPRRSTTPSSSPGRLSSELREEINAVQKSIRIQEFIDKERTLNPNYLLPQPTQTTTLAE